MIYGWELLMDLKNCSKDIIQSEDKLREYVRQLLEILDMKPYGECLVEWFGDNLDKTRGYSIFQFIETSSIVGHFTDDYLTAHIDIFSCKEFDYKRALDFTKKYFNAMIINIRYVRREMGDE